MENKECVACRVCGSNDLASLFSLGNHFVNDFPTPENVGKGPRCPIEIVMCGGCGLVQQRWTAPQELLYRRHYHYRSGTTETMRNALKEVVAKASTLVDLGQGDAVMDIGSNDGTLLRYYPDGIDRIGIEPADNLATPANYEDLKLVHDFWPTSKCIRSAKVITALGMFYDLEDPGAFVRGVAEALAPGGVFVAQLMCLRQMVMANDVGNLCVKADTLLLGDNVRIGDSKVGQQTFGRQGSLSRIEKTFRRPYKGKMVKIKPMYLEELACTPEHPVLIARMQYLSASSSYREGSGLGKTGPRRRSQVTSRVAASTTHPTSDRRLAHDITWVDAKDVVRGDFVVVPRLKSVEVAPTLDLTEYNNTDKHNTFPLTEIPFNEDFAWLMGLYTAEGCRGGSWSKQQSVALTLHAEETDIINRVKSVMGSIGYKISVYPSKLSKAVQVPITCAPLSKAFDDWFGRGACNKKIPDFILQAPDDLRQAYLRGLYAGDGFFKGNKAALSTSSRVLALQVQLLLVALGAPVGICWRGPRITKIRGKTVVSKESWIVRGSSSRLAEILGYTYSGGRQQRHGYIGKDYVLLPVKNVGQEDFEGEVCNVETSDHTYLVSNAVVHNCHEHLEFYSLRCLLDNLLKPAGLRCFDIEENGVNGGSYRLWCCHSCESRPAQQEYPMRLARFLQREESMGLNSLTLLKEWWGGLVDNRHRLRAFLQLNAQPGKKKIWVLGASTKGNTILQFLGLDSNIIQGAFDRSLEKVGRCTVTGIKIYSEDDGRGHMPDLALVLPYAFRKEIIAREASQLWRIAGGKLVFPLPTMEVV